MPGTTVCKIEGSDLTPWFNEAGGHRIQRIPPTEKKGRTHTSTVTVAILEKNPVVNFSFNENDCEINWFSGTGPGGQNRNKVMASCRLRHIPTGLVATAQTRSRKTSLQQAMQDLKQRLKESTQFANHSAENSIRKNQVGSGQRSDKIRTIQFQNNRAVDHKTGKKCTAEQYMQGGMSLLWPSTK